MTFVFKNCAVDDINGAAQMGFSGSYYDSTYQIDVPYPFSFRFSKGKIYDFENRYVHSYAPGEVTSISGTFSGSYYDYSINGRNICNIGSKTDVDVTHMWCDASGCALDVEAQVYSEGYGLSIDFPLSTERESIITGVISNTSTESKLNIKNVEMRGSTSKYYSMESFPTSISAGSTGNITMKSYPGHEEILPLSLKLETNVGNIYHIGSVKGTEKPKLTVSSYLFSLGSSPHYLASSNPDNTVGEFYYITNIISGSQQLNSDVNISLEYQAGTVGDYYSVTGVNMVNGGAGYASGTSVIFSDGEITALGEAVIESGVISSVNITNSGAYFLTPPSVTFSSSPAETTTATALALTENWEKTFTGSWELETGDANGLYGDYRSNGLTGDFGGAFYPYTSFGPGIYENSNTISLANEYPAYIKITNKRSKNSSSDLAKLKITNGFDTKGTTITGGHI